MLINTIKAVRIWEGGGKGGVRVGEGGLLWMGSKHLMPFQNCYYISPIILLAGAGILIFF